MRLAAFNAIVDSMQVCLWQIRSEHAAGWHAAHDARWQAALLQRCAAVIDARVLNCSEQDYEPQGASAAAMLAEPLPAMDAAAGGLCVAHLDKSHVCSHSYPDEVGHEGWFAHRLDIDVSTCGFTSPLRCLDELLTQLPAQLLSIDIQRRGLTRDEDGRWSNGGPIELPPLPTGFDWQTGRQAAGVRLLGAATTLDPAQRPLVAQLRAAVASA